MIVGKLLESESAQEESANHKVRARAGVEFCKQRSYVELDGSRATSYAKGYLLTLETVRQTSKYGDFHRRQRQTLYHDSLQSLRPRNEPQAASVRD
jgi:hypothetical protein